MMTRRLSIALVLLATMPTVGRAAEILDPQTGVSDRIDAIRQRGSLRIAVQDEYPWLKQNSQGASSPFTGPAWRLAEEYARRLGVRLETVPVGSADKVSILATGHVDITIAPLIDTPAREKVVDFIFYSTSAQCMFGLASNVKFSQAGSIDDLNRPATRIAYVKGTPSGSWIVDRLPQATKVGVTASGDGAAVDEILSGGADAAPIDKFFFADLARKVPGLGTLPKGDACLGSEEMATPVGIAVDKNQPAFLAWLREVAEAIKPEVEAEEARVVKAGG